VTKLALYLLISWHLDWSVDSCWSAMYVMSERQKPLVIPHLHLVILYINMPLAWSWSLPHLVMSWLRVEPGRGPAMLSSLLYIRLLYDLFVGCCGFKAGLEIYGYTRIHSLRSGIKKLLWGVLFQYKNMKSVPHRLHRPLPYQYKRSGRPMSFIKTLVLFTYTDFKTIVVPVVCDALEPISPPCWLST